MERYKGAVGQEAERLQKRKELKHIFRESFRFSQGDEGIQVEILRWLKKSTHLDGYTIPEDIPDDMLAIRQPKNHHPQSSDSSKANDTRLITLEGMWKHFYTVTSKESKEDLDEIEATITTKIIEKEKYYQETYRGGRNFDADSLPDSPADPYGSQLRKYALNGATTGSQVYDTLFARVKACLFPVDQPSKFAAELQELGTLWEKRHPGEQFLAPEMMVQTTQEPQLREYAQASIAQQEGEYANGFRGVSHGKGKTK